MKKNIYKIGSLVALIIITVSQLDAQVGVHKSGTAAGAFNSTGDYNTFLGDSAGYINTSGSYNTFLGYRAGYSLNFSSFTQSDNTVIGANAMAGSPFSVSSTDNVIIGKMAGYNHYGTDVVIIGTHAGYNNENGADVVFIGEEAGYNNTTGDDNVFIGEDAGYNNTSASDNTFVGNQSGKSNSTGYRNTFLGNEAGWDNTTGYRNTFIGDSAGIDLSDGHHNTFIGQASGSCTEYADGNTFVGSYAGWDNNRTNETNNANYNTYLGFRTGFTNREGQYNVLIGALTDFSSTAMSGNGSTNSYNIGIGYDALINGELVYAGVLGANARVSSNNSLVIGGLTSTTRMTVGIGTDSPNQNASLELAESNKGFMISRMADTDLTNFTTSLTASDEGMMVYDLTEKQLKSWDGAQWSSTGLQNLSLSSNQLSISEGNTIDLSAYMDNTDAQNLNLISNTLSISNGNNVDLTGYLDNTDSQDLLITNNELTISNGATTVDLSPYLDNTDSQDLQITGNDLSITNGATTVDLSSYLDNTDAQTLELNNNELTISGGNTVSLSTLQDGFEANTDEQDLTSATLSGTTLEVSIENGTSVSVDLAPILADINTAIQDYQTRITQLEADVAELQSQVSSDKKFTSEGTNLKLSQNIPNPSNNTTKIDYFVPHHYEEASIVIADMKGVIMEIIDLESGSDFIEVDLFSYQPGSYIYTLNVIGENPISKKMIVSE